MASWVQAKKAKSGVGDAQAEDGLAHAAWHGRPSVSPRRQTRVVISHERRPKQTTSPSSAARAVRSPEVARRERRDTSPSSSSSSSSSSGDPVPIRRRETALPHRESSRSVLHIQQAAELLFSPPPLRAFPSSSSSISSPSPSASPINLRRSSNGVKLHNVPRRASVSASPSSSGGNGMWNQFWDLLDDVEADKAASGSGVKTRHPRQRRRRSLTPLRAAIIAGDVDECFDLEDIDGEGTDRDEDVTQGVGELVQRLNSGLLDEALRDRLGGISRSTSGGSGEYERSSTTASGTIQLQKLQERFMRYREELMMDEQSRAEEMEQLAQQVASPSNHVGSFGSFIGRCLGGPLGLSSDSPRDSRLNSRENSIGDFVVGSGCFEDNDFFRHLLHRAASPSASASATPPLLFSL